MNSLEHHGNNQINAQAQVMAAMQQAMVMGRNDYEPAEFQKISAALTAGTMDPDEALRKVSAIMNSKQDYN